MVPSGLPVSKENLEAHPDYLLGWRLFQQGYPWEAHEAWEAVWRGLPETCPGRVLVRALIRIAAAAVKARQRNRAGVAHHLEGAIGHLRSLGDTPLAGIAPSALVEWIAGIDQEKWLNSGPDEPGPMVGIGPH